MKLLSVVVVLVLQTVGHNAQVEPTRGLPWPLPQNYASTSTYFVLDPDNFNLILTKPKCDILVKAVKRYRGIIFPSGCSSGKMYAGNNNQHIRQFSNGQLFNITIQVDGACEKYPYNDMDEQYALKINDPDIPNQAVLFSETVWGALRGLETFSQLVYEMKPGMFAVNTTSILDFPRFSFRGVMLDTSRHFVPLPVILQNLDAMAFSKFNVFHWHIVDDPSFPYTSKKYPDLSTKGAYDPVTHVYSQKDVAAVIEYARLRGIRVLPEFDTPGHTLSWGKGQPGLLTSCFNGTSPIPGSFGPIDPTNDSAFEFMQGLFGEITEVFPDDYLHLGGDEVSFDCWKSNPVVQQFMESHEFGDDYSLLEQYYIQRLLDIVKSYKKSYIVWQEVFDNNVKVEPDTVIHVWKNGYQQELSNVTAAGLKTILSACWYLNEMSYGPDWIAYYNCDPHDFKGSPSQKRLVVGGEACMWGEFVDGSNLISRTWPRASVVGERLWSSETVKSAVKAAPRLEGFRCAMVKRGLKFEPVTGPGFCECDYLS